MAKLNVIVVRASGQSTWVNKKRWMSIGIIICESMHTTTTRTTTMANRKFRIRDACAMWNKVVANGKNKSSSRKNCTNSIVMRSWMNKSTADLLLTFPCIFAIATRVDFFFASLSQHLKFSPFRTNFVFFKSGRPFLPNCPQQSCEIYVEEFNENAISKRDTYHGRTFQFISHFIRLDQIVYSLVLFYLEFAREEKKLLHGHAYTLFAQV